MGRKKLTKRQEYAREYWQRDEVKKRKAEQNFTKYNTDPKYKKRQNKANKDYYEEHRDSLIKKQTKYNQEHADERKEYARKYYLLHKDKLKKRQKKYYRDNIDQYKEYNRN